MSESTVKYVFSQSLHNLNRCNVLEKNCKYNVKIINSVLDELNSVDDKDIITDDPTLVEDLITTIIEVTPDKNDHILSKFCHFIYSVHHKKKAQLSIMCIEIVTRFVIEAIDSCNSWVLIDVLNALATLLKDGPGCSEKFFNSLVGPEGVLIDLVSSGKHDIIIKHAALKCLEALILKKPTQLCLNDDHFLLCCSICADCLKNSSSDLNDANIIAHCKILVSSLRCLQNIYACKTLRIQNIGELLGSLKVLLYYGIPGQTSIFPTCLYPTLMSQYTPDSKIQDFSSFPKLRKQNKKARRNRQKKKQTSGSEENSVRSDSEDSFHSHSSSSMNSYSSYSFSNSENQVYPNWVKSSSSDSEFSDTEGGEGFKIKLLQSRVRQNAYSCLQTILKAMEKKMVFGYWSSFLPDSPTALASQNLNIFTSILKDPSPQVRFGAVCLLADMMRGSKQFLSLVDESSSSRTSYTPVSSVLSSMVYELHRRLLLALVAENSSSILTQILKCYAVIIDNVPYKRLNSDILLKLLRHLRPFVAHKDLQVQVACLTVFGSIINSCQVPDIVIAQLLESNDLAMKCKEAKLETCQSQVEMLESHPNFSHGDKHKLPWIVAICKNNLMNKGSLSPLPVRLESLQVLAIFVGRYFHVMRTFLPFLEELILLCLSDPDLSVQLHGAKLLEVTGRCILNDVNSEHAKSVPSDVIAVVIAYEFWNKLLLGPLPACLTNQMQQALQSICCDCLSTIPPEVFEQLSKNFRILCITLLLGLATDADPNVQGAAIRCLGVYSLFLCLREDLAFLSDVANILVEAVKDSNFNIRSKASWALGNLSDALLLSRKQCPLFCEKVTVTFFHSVCIASIIVCQDCDKVRCNAVRTLGNLLRYVPSHFLENSQITEFVKSATASLLSALSASVMKVCWNACYALGNAFKNIDLIHCGTLDIENILFCLLKMLKCTNFKVRINAALALSSLPSRLLYGNLFGDVWVQLLMTLHSSQTDVDFRELKHHENLCDQICYSIIQLAFLIENKDLDTISEGTSEAAETLLTYLWKFGFRTDESKISGVYAAVKHLASLKQNSELLGTAEQVINLLQDALGQATLAFQERETE